MPPVLSSNIQTVQSRNLTEVPTLHVRALIDPSADSTTRTLIIVGITCGTLAAVVLVGIFVYLVIRHRRLNDTYTRTRQYRHSVPASSRIRNGYTRSRAESNSTMNSRKTTSTRDQPQGYFKSWSSRTKTAYLSLPVPGVVQVTDSPPERIQLGGYQYDPALPKREKPKKKKSMRERLRLDTNIIAPSPRLDLNADPNRQSTLLMKSATSPPPFAQYFPNSAPSPNRNSNTVGQHIRPRAELKVGETPSPRPRGGAAGQAGLGSFVPPPPPSWASFWPTESGWTGPGGDPSIRDEDFGSDSDESWSSDKKPHLDSDDEGTPSLARKRKLDDENGEEGQYATDNREYTVGPFRLTPRDLQGNGNGRGSLDVESVSSRGTVSPEPGHLSLSIPPETAEPMLASPRVDLLEDYTQSSNGSSDRLERTTTGKLTLAFGRRSNTVATKSSGKSRRTSHSRNGSSVSGVSSRPSRPSRSNTTKTGLTRSSTTRTDRTDYTEQTMSPMSTVSGQILAALTGHVATPLLRSVSSLGRSRDETQDASASQARAPRPVSMPVRRLPTIPISVPPVPAIPPVPALPSSVSVPPVPPIPRRHVEPPRPLPIPVPTPVPAPRSMSLNIPASRSPAQVRAAPPCSPPIRPLPLPPVPS